MRDLTKDSDTAVLVGDRIIDLDAPVHRAWMKHNCSCLQSLRSIHRQPEKLPIVCGDTDGRPSFVLYSQHHDRIKIADDRIHIVRYGYKIASFNDSALAWSNQRWRSDQRHSSSKLSETMKIRMCDSAAGDVTHDPDPLALDDTQ